MGSQTAASTLEQYLKNEAAPRFSQLVDEAERKVAAAVQDLEDLRGAVGTACWMVAEEAPVYLNIADGRIAVDAAPSHEPFMTVQMSAADWERFSAGAGGGFLNDRSGQRRFGRSRIERLRGVRGTVRFVFTGLADGADWTCDVAFNDRPAVAPNATVTVPADTIAQIQGGQLEPQLAFMQGRIKLSGDAGLVMQLGMAMFM